MLGSPRWIATDEREEYQLKKLLEKHTVVGARTTCYSIIMRTTVHLFLDHAGGRGGATSYCNIRRGKLTFVGGMQTSPLEWAKRHLPPPNQFPPPNKLKLPLTVDVSFLHGIHGSHGIHSWIPAANERDRVFIPWRFPHKTEIRQVTKKIIIIISLCNSIHLRC